MSRWIKYFFCLFIVYFCLFGLFNLRDVLSQNIRTQEIRRIVSLAPSLTETVYALGAGNLLVGVTRYCDYPAPVAKLPKVGGLLDPNYEVILSLRPDVVLTLADHEGTRGKMERLGLNTHTVGNTSIAEILSSIESIGKLLGKSRQAEALVSKLVKERDRAGHQFAKDPPRVLVAVGGHLVESSLDTVYVAGRSTFFEELVVLAGGENAYRGQLGYPSFSPEGLLALKPDVIIDLVPDAEKRGIEKEAVLKAWRTFPELAPVKQNRVFVFTEEYMVNPGPRFVKILAAFTQAIHAFHDPQS